MDSIIIDRRMRKIEKEYLQSLGYQLITVDKNENLYPEISSHVDIHVCNVKDTIVYEPSMKTKLSLFQNTICGQSKVDQQYPKDVLYNVAVIGNYAIHSKYIDPIVHQEIQKKSLTSTLVKQGYTNCSIVVIDDHSCITCDMGIYHTLKDILSVLYIDPSEVDSKLYCADGTFSCKKGFLGGSMACLKDKVILFGDDNQIKENSRKNILSFVKERKKKWIDFKGFEIVDYGGIVTIGGKNE